MTINRRNLLAAVSAGALAPALPTLSAEPAAAGLRAILDSFADAMMENAPENATHLGVDKGAKAGLARRLSDLSPAGEARTRALMVDYRKRLTSLDRAAMSPRDQIQRDSTVQALDLEIAAHRFDFGANGMGGASPYVVSQQGGAYISTPVFLDNMHRVEDREGAEAYLSRLSAFGRVLGEETAKIERDAAKGVIPPDFILDTTLSQLAALRGRPAADQGLVTSLTKRTTAKGLAGDWGARATRAVEAEVYPALDRQIGALKSVRQRATSDAGVWKLPDGEAYYAWALKAGTTTNLTAEQIHTIGLDQNRELAGRMDAILKGQGLTEGSLADRIKAVSNDPRYVYPDSDKGRADLIDYVNGQVASMRARMPSMSKLGLKAEVVVKAVPVDIQDGAPGGYMYPGSLDGTRPSIYYINLKTMTDWPRWSLPTLTVHEGVPGHVWQLAYLADHNKEMPVINSMIYFNGFVEGWALYAEQLADEFGAYANDPLARLGYLQAQRTRAIRLVVDTGLHAKRWTRDQTAAWMVAETGKPSLGAIDRYCGWPGQACGYKVGHNEILRLRDKAKAALGARFDLRDYNDAIVTTGGVPLTVLETAVDMYIARVRGPG